MTARTALLSITSILITGVIACGCSDSSSGRAVPAGSTNANLIVTNRDQDTIHIFIDGGDIGSVTPNQTVSFSVNAGTRVVAFRETGDNTPDVQGEYVFTSGAPIRLTYDPSVVVNFRVRNTGTKTIDVFVDFDDKGSVQPGTIREWKLVSGIRDVHIRETGDSTADYVGTFNINTSGVTDITHP